MSKGRLFCGGSILSVILALAAAAPALAQAQPPVEDEDVVVEEITVTGSFLGTREDTALPVDVISTEALQDQGSPTVLSLVKTLTASASGLGESNRYNGGAGTASVNLRGFGSSRTLVLMNGRRLADSAQAAFQGGGADLNFIPSAAIGRIEVLKDGAAATYGSEAIGGVVNFITRTDLVGFEASGDYAAISDSDGDYRASLAWGWRGENGNILLTAGYRHRSRVDSQDRDWAIQPFESVNYGGWSGNSNPGNYVANSVGGAFLFRDVGCKELGGELTNTVAGLVVPVNPLSPETTTSACRFQFTNFNDVVNEEDHYQLYGEVNQYLTETLKFHGEIAWNRNNTPDQRLSPANGNTQFPTPIGLGGTSGSLATPGALNFFVRYNVPGSSPGLRDLTGQTAGSTCLLTAAQCAAVVAAGPLGVDMSQTAFRFISNAGHPTNADKSDHQDIQATAYRISGGFSGELMGSMKWDSNLTYMKTEVSVNTNDLLVNRVQNALNGHGSRLGATDQCTIAERTAANAGNAAVGCFYFNPFSNSIAVSGTNDQPNPFYRGNANPALNNDPQVLEWLYGNYTNQGTAEIFTAEGLVRGDTPWELPGGIVEWAAGAQYRWNRDTQTYGDLFNNEINPCVDSIDDDTPVCGAPAGPLIFFGSNANADESQEVGALYGEARFPLLESLEATLAIRTEKFSNGLSTTNPKIALKWSPLDWLAFRASAGSTFRAPSAAQINPGCAVGVANLGGQYRAVQTCGNPALTPEEADAYNLGAIFNRGGFNITLDYYLIKFEGELTTEGSSNLFAAMFTPNHCGDAAFAALQARFTFSNAGCAAANVLKVDTFTVNGPGTETSGYDARASYDWEGWWDASYQVGVEATYLERYERGAFTLFGASNVTFAAPFDRAGTHDLQSAFFSYPQTRANIWLNWRRDDINVRWQTRYAEGTIAAINTANDQIRPSTAAPGYVAGTIGKLDDFWQHDVTIRWDYNDTATFTLSVQNVFDTDPPDAPSNYNYDYTTGNPLGRVIQIGATKRF